jgi:hypothetical protein
MGIWFSWYNIPLAYLAYLGKVWRSIRHFSITFFRPAEAPPLMRVSQRRSSFRVSGAHDQDEWYVAKGASAELPHAHRSSGLSVVPAGIAVGIPMS